MFRHLLKIRYLAIVIAILAVLDAVAFLVMGAEISLRAYRHVLGESLEGAATRPGIELLHSIDFLFVSLVLLVLGLGIVKLFVVRLTEEETATLPGWLRIESISELKVLLWEAILTTLLIVALSDLIRGLFTKLEWSALTIPAAILLLALSLFFVKKR
jgi:uncharacterized membrane protein YqhA